MSEEDYNKEGSTKSGKDCNEKSTFWHEVLKCMSDIGVEHSRSSRTHKKSRKVRKCSRVQSAPSFFGMPSQRILDLAKPKKDFSKLSEYCCDHGSGSLWRAKLFDILCRRLLNLAERRKLADCRQKVGLFDESMNPSAFKHRCSDRINTLARPKSVNSYCHANREVIRTITEAAINAIASARINQLARPKRRRNAFHFDMGRPEKPLTKVSNNAKCAIASPRVEKLAIAKDVLHDDQPGHNSKWSISIKTKLALTVPRK
ncbi:sperm microtubule associated protein 2-like isoform X2 [Microcaecilia unicolor]|nr:uncharacterized protein LOC115462474 isoform X2 [Microcaecilia unicolor]XP_030048331.1 uncharacterized protein LOC115462474 isoform X2 [Microcaecilia unicolor]